MTNDVRPPLDRYRILEVGQSSALGLAGMFLAELGAEVVKLERTRPEMGPAFLASNRSKRSVAAGPGTHDEVPALIAAADVLLVDEVGGRDAKLDFDALRTAHPSLVIAGVSAYGRAKEYDRIPPSTVLAAGLSGHVGSQWAFRDGGTYPVNDFGSAIAGVETAVGVISALFAREHDGVGRTVRTSLIGGWLSLRMLHAVTGEGVTSVAVRDPQGGLSPLMRFYPAGDGKWLVLACSTPQFWGKLCIALDRPELVGDPRFDQAPFGVAADDKPALIELLRSTFATATRDAWIARLRGGDVPCAPVNSIDEAYDEPQVTANRGVVTIEQPGVGPVRQVGPLVRFHAGAVAVRGPVPAFGEHTTEVHEQWRGASRTHSTPPAPSAAVLPLAGIRVLEICNWVVGPAVGMLLRQLGAEVWKIEPYAGDDVQALMYVYRPMNAGKHVIRIDFKTEKGRALLRRLIGQTDAVYHNQRPHVAEKFGFDEASVRALNTGVVYHQIYSFGRSGPLAGDPAFDQLVPTRAGLSHLQGGMRAGNPPVLHNGSQGDLPGGYVAAMAVCAGLLSRRREPQAGSTASWSVLAEAGYLLGCLETAQYDGRPPLVEGGADFLGPDSAHRLYRCAGDGWVLLAADDDAGWAAVGGITELVLPNRDDAVSEPFDGPTCRALEARFIARPAEEWAALARSNGAPLVVPVHDSRVCGSAHIIENGYDSHATMSGGSVFDYPGYSVQFDGQAREGVLITPDPTVGAWTILTAVGCTDEEIRTLAAERVIVA